METIVENISDTEYLLFERASKTKHEYLYQTMIQMAGATKKHNQISINLAALLWVFLRKSPLNVYQSDMRVFNPTNFSYMYPDVVVSDGEAQVSDEYKDNLLNPLIIIEVLSPSTAVHDKTDKFIACRSIASLKEYVLVWPDIHLAEVYRKDSADHWSLETVNTDTALFQLSSIDFSCPLLDLYEKV